MASPRHWSCRASAIARRCKDRTSYSPSATRTRSTCRRQPGIEFEVEGTSKIIVKGINREHVGQAAADVRKIRPPEPYKGKGIRYTGEYVRRKAGKAGKAAH